VGTAIGVTPMGVNVELVGNDDSQPFFSAKIPVISIHSITQETLPILHSAKDKIDAIQMEHYYTAYRLVGFYLAYLDQKLE
jgi:hypothetical protein